MWRFHRKFRPRWVHRDYVEPPPPPPPPDSPLLDGLEAYWPMREAVDIRYDVAGSANLAMSGTVGSRAGILGLAASSDGAMPNYLYSASTPGLTLSRESDFTLAGWFYLVDGTQFSGLWGKQDRPNGRKEYAFAYFPDVDALIWCTGGGGHPMPGAVWGEGIVAFGGWNFAICEYDFMANEASLEVNRTARDTRNGGASFGDIGLCDFQVLSEGDCMPGKAAVGELGAWSRLLTEDEKDALYNEGAGITWPFVGT